VIYTRFQIQVTERFKGPAQSSVEVVVPGGVANNLRQTFSGTPRKPAAEALRSVSSDQGEIGCRCPVAKCSKIT